MEFSEGFVHIEMQRVQFQRPVLNEWWKLGLTRVMEMGLFTQQCTKCRSKDSGLKRAVERVSFHRNIKSAVSKTGCKREMIFHYGFHCNLLGQSKSLFVRGH